jgi:hypothetical protein
MSPSSDDVPFFNLPHAKWVVRVLSMLIAVVGSQTLLGLILRQTRSEIASMLRGAKPGGAPKRVGYENN